MMSWNEGVIIIGCRHNTLEFIECALRNGRKIAGIVTISRTVAKKNSVPTWADLEKAFGADIPVYVAETYSLNGDRDRSVLSRTNADMGFCIGWQRILPQWFLDTTRHGVFGMHTSQFPLPRGIGRSPLNWALINGAETVHAHVFKYEAEADRGEILDITRFSVAPDDDIHSLQQKCRYIFNRVAERHWDALLQGNAHLGDQQPLETKTEYPKRTPECGRIDWTWPAKQITDWVRAQTRPYPGAFCRFEGNDHRVWQVRPFNVFMDYPRPAGIIEDQFNDGSLLVWVGDGLAHIIDHELPKDASAGKKLE